MKRQILGITYILLVIGSTTAETPNSDHEHFLSKVVRRALSNGGGSGGDGGAGGAGGSGGPGGTGGTGVIWGNNTAASTLPYSQPGQAVAANQTSGVGVNQTSEVGANQTSEVGANQTSEVGANQTSEVGANQTSSSTIAVNVAAPPESQVNVSAPEGSSVNVSSPSSVSLNTTEAPVIVNITAPSTTGNLTAVGMENWQAMGFSSEEEYLETILPNCTCEVANLTNGKCDWDCATAECNWDNLECQNPLPECECDDRNKLGNGKCDWSCNTQECNWDGMDCAQFVYCPCDHVFVQNGVCDADCNVAECEFDGGDCQFPEIGFGEETCNCVLYKRNDTYEWRCDNYLCNLHLVQCIDFIGSIQFSQVPLEAAHSNATGIESPNATSVFYDNTTVAGYQNFTGMESHNATESSNLNQEGANNTKN
jgi:hypothetical protein